MSNLTVNFDIYQILKDYEVKKEAIPKVFNNIVDECGKLENLCSTMGAFGGTTFEYDFTRNNVKSLLKVLNKSSWRFVYDKLNIKHIAPATHLQQFDRLLENPPEFTEQNIIGVFKEYVSNARGMFLEAFAEVFCTLDSFYKSHSNVRIGVKGLPKRVIVPGCGSYSSDYGWKKIADIINCLMRYRNRTDLCIDCYNVKGLVTTGMPYMGLAFKHFKNGNCHIIFDDQALIDTNEALAEYYGDVLPDAYDHSESKAESTEVCKDLQFYRTPKAVVDRMLEDIHLYKNESKTFLEPSCGDGSILMGIRNKFPEADITGVEIDADRCNESRLLGFTVYNENFLEFEIDKKYDFIIMNPPFYGTHYAKHIEKAYSLLAEDGKLMAVLPITAKLNHGILDEKYKVEWRDLPLGSFKESGTNINTTVATICEGRAK